MKKKYYCKEKNCNNKITITSAVYGKGRCGSCAHIELYKNPKNHPFFGKGHTKETKQKISKNNKGKKSSRYIDGRCSKQYYCKKCNKEIEIQSGLYGSGLCASCAKQGKNHPNWNNGSSFEPYTSEFNDKLKLKIRTRDNFECQNCDMTEEEHLVVYGRVLDVHHIDYDKENCQENNLIALCTGCNTRANFNKDYWFAYFTCIMEEK